MTLRFAAGNEGIQSAMDSRPLDVASFAPFGNVFSLTGNHTLVNQGRGTRTNLMLDSHAHDPRATRLQSALYRLQPSLLPLTVTVLERHPLSAQLFLPLRVGQYLVVVCGSGSDGLPDLATACAFTGKPTQAIQYQAGTWHAPLIALDQPGEFLMQLWESDSALDCEEIAVAPLLITA